MYVVIARDTINFYKFFPQTRPNQVVNYQREPLETVKLEMAEKRYLLTSSSLRPVSAFFNTKPGYALNRVYVKHCLVS